MLNIYSRSATDTLTNSALEDLDNFDDSLLLDMIDRRKSEDKEPLALPLLDQSDDPYLNHQGDTLPFVTEELDDTVQKWMEACDGAFI